MTTDQIFLDKCKYEIIPWLHKFIEVEKIHLSSLKTKLKNTKKWNSTLLGKLFPADTLFISECIDHSKVIIKATEDQIQDYHQFISENDK